MANQTVISLAILKVNWDMLKKDYLENFVPIVAECIRLSQDDVVSLPDLQKGLRTQFGLEIPQNAIRTILQRVRKQGYIRLEHGSYHKNPEKLDQLEFYDVQQQVVRMHEVLIRHLVAFCSERFGATWSTEDAETALGSYLENSQLLVISATSHGAPVPVVQHHVKGATFLVSAFVQYLQETQAADFEYLETIVKGNMLANAIFLTEPGQTQRKFRETEVYFDTSFLIYALGYAGQARQDPCVELLELLYETGANIRCFRHTLDEVRGALNACANRISQGQLKDAYGPSIEYFLSKGYAASDIELLCIRLERDLQALRIRVVDKPPYIHKCVIDESGLTQVLNEKIVYRNPQALSRDVDSVSAIMRLRWGQEFFTIERCRALFITVNWRLAQVSLEFFREESSPRTVGPCLTDYTLTNLLWLKRPLKAPDLPRKRIIADYYAATRPPERLWRNYLVEIDKLEQSGKVTTDEYYMLRHSLEAKSALMRLTLGEEDAFTQGTVPEILELVRSRIQADFRSELESEIKLREAAEKAVESAKAREDERLSRVRVRAQSYSSTAARVLEYGMLILVFIGTLYTFPWDFPFPADSPIKYGISFILAALLILAVLNIMYGTTLESFIRKFEMALSGRVERKLLALSEYPSANNLDHQH